jgi:hypothetical protein
MTPLRHHIAAARRRAWRAGAGAALVALAATPVLARPALPRGVARALPHATTQEMVWTYLSPEAGVVGRQGASLTYDPTRQRMILFGGYDGSRQRELNDVWELALPSAGPPVWREIKPAGKPPAGRDGHVAVLDPVNDRLVVYGGQDRGMSRVFGDVQVLSLAPGHEEWTPVAVAGAVPMARALAGGVYDPAGARLVVFGGTDRGTSSFGDTWALSLPGSGVPTWTELHPAGTAPAARESHLTVHDPRFGLMIVFGGYSRWHQEAHRDVMALALTPGAEAWTQLATSDAPGPVSRFASAGVFDPFDERVVVYGGSSQTENFSDVWCFDLLPTGTWSGVAAAGGPGYRVLPAAAFDAANGRMILFGGYQDFHELGDVWALQVVDNVPTPTPTFTPTNVSTPTPTPTDTPSEPPTLTPRPTPTRGGPTKAYLPSLVLVRLPPPTATPTVPPCVEEEREPNNSLTEADANPDLCPDATIRGTMPDGDDWDLYRVEVRRAGDVEVDLGNLPFRTDYDVYLYDDSDNADPIAYSNNAGTEDEHFRVHVGVGRYYIGVYRAEGASLQSYRLRWFLY